MDCRHPLTELDQQMLDWFSPQKKPIHVLLTKADKLSRNSAQKTLLETTKNIEMRWQNCSVQLFSSLKKQGIEEAKQKIEEWLCHL